MSDVWEYILKTKNNDNVIVSLNCQLCEAEYGVSTSTATLRWHLTSIHSSIYKQDRQGNQPEQNSSYTFTEQIYITIKLVEWIVVDLQPFSIVKQAEFKQLIYTLDPRYVIPCRQIIKREVNLLFNKRKTNIKLELNNISTKIVLTTDIWSSKYNNVTFLDTIMHY